MIPGHVLTPLFTLNTNRVYTVEIVAKKTIPFDKLNCLLGMPQPGTQYACKLPSVIKATWTLKSGDTITAQGTSESNSDGGGWSDGDIARSIGTFQSEKSRSYVLDVNFLTDGTALSATDPHLKVEVSTDYYEADAWRDLFFFYMCADFMIVGLLLIAVSSFRFWWKGRVAHG